MSKQKVFTMFGFLFAVALFFGGRSVYYEYYPVPIKPSASWAPYINSLDAQRESFFVDANGIKLEADLFIPNGGVDQKPAIVFSPGSGDSLYQNYAPGFIETYILDFFLSRDFAVLLVNKRGMGQSEGLYTDRSIEGRAEDLLISADTIRAHPQIDAQNIGLVGHSEGGWTVNYAAAQDSEIAFFVSLAGPTITRKEQAFDYYTYDGICSGFEGDELVQHAENRMRATELGAKIGKVTNLGMLGFDYRTIGFDPRDALRAVESPGLFIWAENDILVLPEHNIERMDKIFNGDIPDNLKMVVVEDATHIYKVVDTPCDSWNDPMQHELSAEVVNILDNWLTALGY